MQQKSMVIRLTSRSRYTCVEERATLNPVTKDLVAFKREMAKPENVVTVVGIICRCKWQWQVSELAIEYWVKFRNVPTRK